jgi:hypothetical protein
VQPDRETAVALLLHELVRAVVPDLDRAGAVLALRDHTFECRVLEWVIFDVHRQRALPGLQRNALRHGPARKCTVALEPEVVVEPTGVVALDDEDRLLPALLPAEGLRRLLAVPLLLVLGQARARHAP